MTDMPLMWEDDNKIYSQANSVKFVTRYFTFWKIDVNFKLLVELYHSLVLTSMNVLICVAICYISVTVMTARH